MWNARRSASGSGRTRWPRGTDYQTTGLHVTAEEADAWLAKLEAGKRRRYPEMPRLRWSQPALRDVARLHEFLAPKSRDAAQRAVKTIRQGVKALGKHPEIGRPVEELPPEFREWVIEFGHGAYVALYHYDGKQVVILAVRHGREAGY